MLFPESHDRPEFKAWLVRTIEPMCDADPEVMSDYIVALLKHDATMSEAEWKEFIARELIDFLEDKSRPFVDLLFSTLQTNSFLPPAPAPAPVEPSAAQMSKPIPTGPSNPSIVSSYRPQPPANAPSGPSAQQPLAGPSTFRPFNGTGQPNGIGFEGNGNGNGVVQNAGIENIRPPQQPGLPAQRPKCRDYHERGYCMRGVNCPYEHSDDVIIPTPEMMFPPFPFMQEPMRGGGDGRGRGGRGQNRGGRGGAQGNRESKVPSDEFTGDNKPPRDRNGNTLVITDIPAQHLTVQAIREYFNQFGEVTNVAVEGRSSRALVSFTGNFEAYQAWKSDAAVFGSRHVKVLWHRPRPGQGGAGMTQLEKSAGLLANMKAMEGGSTPQGEVKAQYSGPEQRLAATLRELEEKERRSKKETLMAEQKVLLKRAQDGSKEEKMEILKRIKVINKEIEELDKPPLVVEKKAEGEGGDVEMGQEGQSQDELMRLSAQLANLRDKANNLGMHPAAAARYSPYSIRARGRGRGRGRGGGAIRGPMRLDNRTRSIFLTGEAIDDNGAKQALRGYYESTGGVLEEVEGGIKVAYPNQEMAEKVMAIGSAELPDLAGKYTAGWYSVQPPSGATNGGGAVSQEVEMVEEAQRGERDEED